MKLKSLMLGVAAAATATTAQAADLPVAPEPVDYVRICDAYGARFFYIPGTETCLRVAGRLRTQVTVNNVLEDGDWSTRDSDGITWETRGYVRLDARTATEFGDLRTFISISQAATNGAEAANFDVAYIQWGGLKAGYDGSLFQHYTGQVFKGSLTRNWSDNTINQINYTAAFGNGFYAAFGLEDQDDRFNLGGTVATSGGGTLTVGEGGTRMPDFVAAIGVTQGWGAAKLSGALHQSVPNTVHNSVGFSGEDTLGWAVGASVLFNLDMLSSGSNVFFQGFYADGALNYIGYTPVIDNIGDDTATGYSLSAGVYFQATPTIGLALDGSYADVEAASDTVGGVVVSQADATRYAIAGSVQWAPVSGLAIGADIGYANEDIDGAGDTDELVFGVRMQRDF
ncbi:porin [Roseibium denhamense]|uniref:Porin n=1 Tax=Roseibium denhamense TaxID=76305 RepID=A0ABY1NWP5_9HYPH|nr:porin [Roseibium denhamense]MTI04446.1 porin [Roseibium denhamense]SMP19483.1 Porin subfamily protein [Roseibium denhamense]